MNDFHLISYVGGAAAGGDGAAGRKATWKADVEPKVFRARRVRNLDELKLGIPDDKEQVITLSKRRVNSTIQILQCQPGHAKKRRNNEVNRVSPPRFVADTRSSSF